MTGSPWVALLVALAAGNPARRALPLLPAAGPVRLLGALVTVGVLLAVGLTAGAVTGALEVGVPTVLVAAGLVVGTTALADVLAPEPAALGGLGERGAAWCPVAFPHLLRPQLALAILAAGAAHGAVVGAVLALAAPALTLLLATLLADGPPAPRAVLAGGRVLAVAGVLGAVDLVLDGIFAV
ncbi:MAG: hypothetical protein GEV08_13720 [Acidimicrobiia bacterium]|nr:hypothetical protein [Acidimicrobiia bacterium]